MPADNGPSKGDARRKAHPAGPAAQPNTSREGSPPVFRGSTPDGTARGPLEGSEATATVRSGGPPEGRTTAGRPGDVVDGDEGSATGSRTPGQTNRA
jgi:hypothetical protein